MRVLLAARDLPWPPNNGGRQRTFAILRALARRHEVTLTVPGSIQEEAELPEGLAGLVQRIIPASPDANRRLPWPSGSRTRRLGGFLNDVLKTSIPYNYRMQSIEYTRLLRPEIAGFDAVFCRSTPMISILDGWPRNRIVLDADDLYYRGLARQVRLRTHGWGTPLVAMEACRTYVHESRLLRGVAQALVSTEADLARIHCRRKSVLANGIDLPDLHGWPLQPRPNTIVFVGTASYDPNTDGLRWFLSRVWPLLRCRSPEVELKIVGRDANLETLPFASVDGVELVANVEETSPYIMAASLSIVPLLNGMGTRIKIAESLAHGRAVVSTTIGAEGYDGVEECHGLIRADRPEAMADRISRLLADPEGCLALGRVGRSVAEARFTWESITANLASDIERWVEAAGGLRSVPPGARPEGEL